MFVFKWRIGTNFSAMVTSKQILNRSLQVFHETYLQYKKLHYLNNYYLSNDRITFGYGLNHKV